MLFSFVAGIADMLSTGFCPVWQADLQVVYNELCR